MHFAYPPRKDSNPPPFRPRSARLPSLRRNRLRAIALVVLALVAGWWLLSGPSLPGPAREHVPSGQPPVVIVTVLDAPSYSSAYLQTIKDNRNLYAQKHGYESMVVKALDYDTQGAPQSWAKLMAVRHALSKFPDCKFVWYLDQNAYIMDPRRSLEEQVLSPGKLESLMIKDYPVVPPDSIIKTFAHLRGNAIDLVVAQDKTSLISDSFVVRNGEWAKFFLETWLDPLYRSYNFGKAETHALEHIVQWHPTILSKLALVPQKTIAAYTSTDKGEVYQDGDFVVMFAGCSKTGLTSCETESAHFRQKWQKLFGVN
ncbi:hypothetical protein ESCO_001309 [Escovopsis weberi]|uniref:Alpha-1 n=1 Tax=Escovopsis weberi TaxID=150374 RepID=A0A0M8N2C7_ESCWE|nr:hypothetical protein ESCO_001309 [Escovopsis weberi]